ncbi:GGDEF domain-containing protein [Vibrio sp. SCSIO 43136]|uniref:GGDEF domain-containing protein n=1 Tax=Vibrio sp. SCSIO 43136 TaxID=2819101 RepID=UPI002074E639|nr:GGDEF domain-containing protein [Vibrio sp. SCSIO 43136]USD67701.1 GGDEF domain-containing protein [Vibrio sp. SCSIO 43136]
MPLLPSYTSSYSPIARLRYQSFFQKKVYQPHAHFNYLPPILFVLFSLSDLIHFNHYLFEVVGGRLVIGVLLLIATYWVHSYKPKYLEITETIAISVVCLFLIGVGRIALANGDDNYQNGLILVIIYIGTFSRLSLRYAVPMICFALAGHFIGFSFWMYELDPASELERVSIYLSTFILCVIAVYRRELECHVDFRRRENLRSQSIRLIDQIQTLTNQTLHDPLTGLRNRLYLTDIMPLQLADNGALGVMMLDVDHFKSINDQYGHLEGDKVLVKLSEHIKKRSGREVTCFRYGGEEFLLVSQNLREEEWLRLADELVKGCHQLDLPFKVTISIGVYHHPRKPLRLESAIEKADTALYKAKNMGRDRFIQA